MPEKCSSINLEMYKKDRTARLIPSIIQIEPIFGCNAKCIMCVIDLPTKRKKGPMPMALFKKVVNDLYPYRERIVQIDLFGLGEPLLDKHIFERIRHMKEKGFCGVGISTNMDLMDEKKQEQLLKSGLDTVIVSIDSLDKEIHEKIRVNTSFERVMANTNSLIQRRDAGQYKTKFIFRCIGQDMNRSGWEEYKSYWGARLDRRKGDQVNYYEVHNWVGEARVEGVQKAVDVEELECYQMFDRVFILADGTMSMCSCDLHHPNIAIGNVADTNLIDLYNSERIREIRDLHVAGKKNTIETCRQCTMLYSRRKKAVF